MRAKSLPAEPAVKAPRKRRASNRGGPTDIKFEVRVASRKGQSKLFDTYDSIGRAKRVAARLTEAGVPAAIVKVARKIVWHHASR